MPHTTTTQLGPGAVAAPAATLPAEATPAPELHHLKAAKHTSHTQLGPNAVAPPANGHANNEGDGLAYLSLPPFPNDVPTAPLLRLSLAKLAHGDEREAERIWRASCDLGFFYLDLQEASPTNNGDADGEKRDGGQKHDGKVDGPGLIADAEKLFGLGEKVFDLPVEEKQQYDFKDRGSYFGYKGLGAGVVDSKGTKDGNEFYNVSKDDILGVGERLPAPAVLQDGQNRRLLEGFMRRSHAVVSLVLGLLNRRLGLEEGTLERLHRLEGVSGDQVRWVRSPSKKGEQEDEKKRALGEHTDFGSITLLHNRLGGLQILPPDRSEWQYVQPLKGHCVCNLGDAMVKFTRGVLRSNIHRVVSPPGEQAGMTRMSLVYFARPEDGVVLKALDDSQIVEGRKGKEAEDDEVITAKEWILRRAMGRRTGGDWKFAQGTEGKRPGMTDSMT